MPPSTARRERVLLSVNYLNVSVRPQDALFAMANVNRLICSFGNWAVLQASSL